MITAETIVSARLESEQPPQRTTAMFYVPKFSGRDGMYVRDQPEMNKDIWQILLEWVAKGRLATGPVGSADAASTVDGLIQNYSMTIVMRDFEGTCHLFNRTRRVRLPDEFLSRVKSLLNIYPTTQLQWHPETEYDTGEVVGADAAIFGMSPADKPKPLKANKPKSGNKRQLDLKNVPDYLKPGQAGLSPEEWDELNKK